MGKTVRLQLQRSNTQPFTQDEETRSFGRTGEYITAVGPDSALLQLPDNLEVKVKVDADHSEIVKFNDRHSEPYKTAIRYLKKFEEDAGKEVPQRFCM